MNFTPKNLSRRIFAVILLGWMGLSSPVWATAPVASGTTVVTNEDVKIVVNLAPLVTNPSGGALTFYRAVSAYVNKGTITVTTAGSATFTPFANYNGTGVAYFKYYAKNAAGEISNTATVNVNITAVNDKPVALAIPLPANLSGATTAEDTPKAITLSATDVDGDPLTYKAATQPSHGTLSAPVGSQITYTPALNYNGADSFTYTASDGRLTSVAKIVSVTVTAVDDKPVLHDSIVFTTEDTPVVATLNATDVDNTLTYAIDYAIDGTCVLGVGNSITFTPAPDFNGDAYCLFHVNDGTSDSGQEMVTIGVNAANDAPVASNSASNTSEDTPVGVTLTATDAEGDVLTYSVVTATNGTCVMGASNTATFTPADGFNGNGTCVFKANDGKVDSNQATVTIAVSSVNDAPVATDSASNTSEDTPVGITFTAIDADDDALNFSVVSATNGTCVIGASNTATFTPTLNFSGDGTCVFKANDGTADSNQATVSIAVSAVNDAPIATDSAANTAEEIPIEITFTASDAEGDTLTYSVVTATNGACVMGASNTATFTPALNFSGNGTCAFKASDGTYDSNQATVTIAVTAVNDPPECLPVAKTVSEDVLIEQLVPLSCTDAEGDALAYTAVTLTSKNLAGYTPSVSGTNYKYKPLKDFAGVDLFTYKATETKVGGLASNTATGTITVLNVNDAPVFASGIVAVPVQQVDEDVPLVVDLKPFISDPDGDVLACEEGTSVEKNGTLTSLSNCVATFTPAENLNGASTNFYFYFTAKDPAGLSLLNKKVSVTVTAVNDKPIVADVQEETPENTEYWFDCDDFASDPEWSGITCTYASPVNGTIAVFSNNEMSFTPTAGFTGSASFTYTASDGILSTDPATVNLTVTVVDAPPVASAKSVTTGPATPVEITLVGSDPEGAAVSYEIVTPPVNGTASLNGNTVTYTPNADFTDTEFFTYAVSDGVNTSEPARIKVFIQVPNAAPVVTTPITGATAENMPVNVALACEDAETPADKLSFIVTSATHGTATVSGSILTYTPATGFDGEATVTILCSDGSVLSEEGAVTITVSGVNNAPSAVALDETTEEEVEDRFVLAGTDPEGSALSFEIVAGPANGTAMMVGAVAVYTPNADFYGADAFTYKAIDAAGLASSAATVAITVTDVIEDQMTSTVCPDLDASHVLTDAATGLQYADNILIVLTATPVVDTGELLSVSGATSILCSSGRPTGNDPYPAYGRYTLEVPPQSLAELEVVSSNLRALNLYVTHVTPYLLNLIKSNDPLLAPTDTEEMGAAIGDTVVRRFYALPQYQGALEYAAAFKKQIGEFDSVKISMVDSGVCLDEVNGTNKCSLYVPDLGAEFPMGTILPQPNMPEPVKTYLKDDGYFVAGDVDRDEAFHGTNIAYLIGAKSNHVMPPPSTAVNTTSESYLQTVIVGNVSYVDVILDFNGDGDSEDLEAGEGYALGFESNAGNGVLGGITGLDYTITSFLGATILRYPYYKIEGADGRPKALQEDYYERIAPEFCKANVSNHSYGIPFNPSDDQGVKDKKKHSSEVMQGALANTPECGDGGNHLTVYAAGNEDIDYIDYPEAESYHLNDTISNTINVGAVNETGGRWEHSNSNGKTDVYAPGNSTSYATPLVTATAALLQSIDETLKTSPTQVKDLIVKSAGPDLIAKLPTLDIAAAELLAIKGRSPEFVPMTLGNMTYEHKGADALLKDLRADEDYLEGTHEETGAWNITDKTLTIKRDTTEIAGTGVPGPPMLSQADESDPYYEWKMESTLHSTENYELGLSQIEYDDEAYAPGSTNYSGGSRLVPVEVVLPKGINSHRLQGKFNANHMMDDTSNEEDHSQNYCVQLDYTVNAEVAGLPPMAAKDGKGFHIPLGRDSQSESYTVPFAITGAKLTGNIVKKGYVGNIWEGEILHNVSPTDYAAMDSATLCEKNEPITDITAGFIDNSGDVDSWITTVGAMDAFTITYKSGYSQNLNWTMPKCEVIVDNSALNWEWMTRGDTYVYVEATFEDTSDTDCAVKMTSLSQDLVPMEKEAVTILEGSDPVQAFSYTSFQDEDSPVCKTTANVKVTTVSQVLLTGNEQLQYLGDQNAVDDIEYNCNFGTKLSTKKVIDEFAVEVAWDFDQGDFPASDFLKQFAEKLPTIMDGISVSNLIHHPFEYTGEDSVYGDPETYPHYFLPETVLSSGHVTPGFGSSMDTVLWSHGIGVVHACDALIDPPPPPSGRYFKVKTWNRADGIKR